MTYENTTHTSWQAQWIWPRGHAWTVNFHALARRAFLLDAAPEQAILRISAATGYILFVNGVRVGRGPAPSDAADATYDTYDIASQLRAGENVLAAQVHNYAVGTHWHNRGRGGLIAQLDGTQAGRPFTIATGGDWRVLSGAGLAPNSPRAFWSAGFLETFDFGAFDPAWLRPGFKDGGWETPEMLGPAGAKPWTRLAARDIPLLRETETLPVSAERGEFTLPPLEAVSFGAVLPPGQAGVVYAQAALTSEAAQDAALHIECDDAFKLFVNGRQAAEQNYSEYFSRTRVWRGKDVYDQVHDGMGDCGYDVPLTLLAGENTLTVAMDQGPGGWGFLLSGLPDGVSLGPWHLFGPFPSSGMNDSLDDAAPSAIENCPAAWSGPASDLTVVTDYAAVMAAEKRGPSSPCAWETLTLRAGEYAIVDLGVVRIGYPDFALEAAEDAAVVDFGFSQLLGADKTIRFSNSGRLKAVDRVLLPAGTHDWQPQTRRTARFLHLSCRRGRVTLRRTRFVAAGYPAELKAEFECSDPLLNRIWERSIYTTQLLMQHSWQDCLKREQGTLNTSSFNYAGRGAVCAFGDWALTRKTIRLAYRTQNETGWLDSHGYSSPNSDEVTECLWLAVWVRDYVRASGDLEFAADVFDGLEDNLRFFDKGINRHGLIEGRNRPWAWQGQGIYLDDTLTFGAYTGLFPGELSGFNLLYAAALEAASELAGHLGLPPAQRERYARRAARVRRSLRERLWDSGAGAYRDWRDGDTLADTHHAVIQITALYFGDEAAQTAALLTYLTETLGLPHPNGGYPLGTFGYYFYFLECLFRAGEDALALDLMRRVHGRWLELGATTLGEFFDPALAAEGAALDEEYEVHAYGTSAHLHFYSNILGVQPAAPGYSRVVIQPHPGDLAWAKGTLMTPQGPISVDWRNAPDGFHLDAALPPGCSATLRLPAGIAAGRVTINGEEQP